MTARSLGVLLLAAPVLALRPARALPAVRARVQRPPLVTPLLEEAAAALWHAEADADFREAKRAQTAKNAVQREATDTVMHHFFGGGDGVGDGDGSRSSRATVVLPGGAGKTVLALRVAEAMHARGALRSVLVLAPSLALVTQTVDEWKLWGEGLDASRALAVCSDADGADFTTSPAEVGSFLAEAAAADVPAVMVGTYASHERVAEALAQRGGELDLLICDEAHRTTGSTQKRDAGPLFDSTLPAARRLFLTATPRLLGGDGELASMDDDALYGPVVYRLSRGEAEERGLVVPLRLVFVNATEAYEEVTRREPRLRVLLDAKARSVSREHAEQVLAVWDCYRRRGVTTAFTFHSSNARAERFQQATESVLAALEGDGVVDGGGGATAGFVTGRVHGAMPVSRRKEVLQPVGARDGKLKVISNCRVLGEGVDVPAVDLVAFIDAKSSHVDILQSMARASRVAPGKECGLVLVMAGEDSLEVDVLRAFAEGDEELREAFYSMARELARTGGRLLDATELPAAVQRLWGGSSLGLERMAGWLSTCVRELAGSWERMHGLLLAYRDREGHCDVPSKHEEQGAKLGDWLSKQRTAFKRGKLESRRVRALEAAGVVWDVVAEQWERNYALLRAYREREGHANVPDRHVEEGERLGAWLQSQRKRHQARGLSEEERKAKRVSPLSDEEVGRLEALGVVWDVVAEQWERSFALLRAYREREGHANVPRGHVEEGEKLGGWLQSQRKRHQARGLSEGEGKAKKIKPLSDEEVGRLEAAGVVWGVLAEQWERNYALLRAYREREGHANVPASHVEEGERLGGWLQRQRKRHQARGLSEEERKAKSASALSDEEVGRLEALGVVWDVLAEQWERNYALLRAYREREGHANVPASHVEEGEKLGGWLSGQRKRHQARGLSEEERKAKNIKPLSDEKVGRLEAAGVVWDVVAGQWERNYALLRAYREREGHANVPKRHVEEGEKLGVWLGTQRKRHQARDLSEEERKAKRVSPLSDEEVGRLEALGVVWRGVRPMSP